MIEPIKNLLGLSALKTAVGQLQQRADEIARDVEGAAARLRILAQQVGIIAEQDVHALGDTPPAVEGRHPELNHHDEE